MTLRRPLSQVVGTGRTNQRGLVEITVETWMVPAGTGVVHVHANGHSLVDVFLSIDYHTPTHCTCRALHCIDVCSLCRHLTLIQ